MKNFYRKIISFLSWLRVSVQYAVFLWNNHHDWDYNYLLDLIRFKLNRAKIEMNKSDFIEGNKRLARQIAYAEMLIQLLLEDDFCSKESLVHDRKWGELNFSFEKKISDSRPSSIGALYREKVVTEQDKEQESNDFLALVELENIRRENTWNRLFKHLSKYMRGWWT